MKRKLYSVYQPIIDIRTEKVFGYEALTRGMGKWRSPEILFRHSYDEGTTVALDLACLESAFGILPTLEKGELLFVNVEPLTLASVFMKGKEGSFLLRKVAPYARRIVFELTEGMKGRDFKFVKKGAGFLKKSGCQFALDDVAGVGFKLFRLLSLKPHFMKIDIGLILGLHKSRAQQEMLRSLVVLGKKTHSLLIAEGIEQVKDLDFVQQMGIFYVQGFYFGRPQKHLIKS